MKNPRLGKRGCVCSVCVGGAGKGCSRNLHALVCHGEEVELYTACTRKIINILIKILNIFIL